MIMLKGNNATMQSRSVIFLLLAAACTSTTPPRPRAPAPVDLPPLALQVEIRRTEHGVPHILAENLAAAAFGLAYVQLEDHGMRVIAGMQAARGRMGLVEGIERVDADARNRMRYARAVQTFDSLKQDTRDVYTGFAEGLNHYIRAYRHTLPDWVQPDFTAIDVFSRDVAWPSEAEMEAFRERLAANPSDPAILSIDEAGTWRRLISAAPPSQGTPADDPRSLDSRLALLEQPVEPARNATVEPAPSSLAEQPRSSTFAPVDNDVGSNAWALGPARTTSGHAILLRNPHLAWTAGYYEAHVRVPGKLDFYGDFRIGGPFSVIGGFNRDLGFATTNNNNRTHEFYAFRTDASASDHILVDGRSVPLTREVVSVEYRDSTGTVRTATREFWSSPFGPIVHRANDLVYVYRPALNGEYRAGEQWLEMMKATNLEEYRRAMRIQARETSNFTYADRAGNIFYVWVSAAPLLPHPAGGDTLAILATQSSHVYQRIAPFDSLPQVLNPPGGYIHNENDSPHFTNLNAILPHDYPYWVEPPALRLRSQHALEILHNDRRFSLDDVIEAKHSMRMLLADRVKPDLIAAVRATSPTGEVRRAIELLEKWDNTVAAKNRGGVLFETWWNRYRMSMRGRELYATPWSADQPMTTPRGLADAKEAADAFAWAVTETRRQFGSWNVAWGDVHRVRRGKVDVPVGGCTGALGCFRVLAFANEPDGKRAANGGDGWVIAVEFGDEPRAYSVLAYGQSPDTASPYHADQAAMFAAGRMKRVRWTEADILDGTIERYRPGREGR